MDQQVQQVQQVHMDLILHVQDHLQVIILVGLQDQEDPEDPEELQERL